MTRSARDVQAGDLFVIDMIRVASVMHEGGSTYISWEGGGRRIDVIPSDAPVPKIHPHSCPHCGNEFITEGET